MAKCFSCMCCTWVVPTMEHIKLKKTDDEHTIVIPAETAFLADHTVTRHAPNLAAGTGIHTQFRLEVYIYKTTRPWPAGHVLKSILTSCRWTCPQPFAALLSA